MDGDFASQANDSTDEPGDWMDNTHEATDVESQGLTHSMKHTIADLEPATDYHATVQVKNKFMWGANSEFAFSTKKGELRPFTSHSTSKQVLLPNLIQNNRCYCQI